MENLVVFTGAGISAESGLKTFRDSGGLWEEYDVYDVATPEAWAKNPALVLEFYNKRRTQLQTVKPNAAHTHLSQLDNHFNTTIITQNVDDLHERGGSKNIIHLHGELTKVRSVTNYSLISDINYNTIELGDVSEDGGQLRPHIVWFGEEVPMFEKAISIAETADIFLVIGSSLQVYPAAGLIHHTKPNCKCYYIDPMAELISGKPELEIIKKNACESIPELVKKLIERKEKS